MLHDKRKFIRFKTYLNLELKPQKEATDYLFGITRNFSQEGLSFVSENFSFEPKKTIELKVKHPQKDSFVSVLGDVVWKKHVRDRCLAGIKIRDMDKEVKSEILNYAHDR